ncbi:unnamed protein product, partial [Prorocentrum cordatum]
ATSVDIVASLASMTAGTRCAWGSLRAVAAALRLSREHAELARDSLTSSGRLAWVGDYVILKQAPFFIPELEFLE